MWFTIASMSRSGHRLIFRGRFIHRLLARRIAVISIVAHPYDIATLHQPIGPRIILVTEIEIAGRRGGRTMQEENDVFVRELRVPLLHLFPHE
jgi:hypothetical protein